MNWVRADASDFGGNLPIARSGHTAVTVGKSNVVVFGGFADRRFLVDISVYDVDNGIWFTPDCTGSGSDGQVSPAPRAFHVAVSIDCHMFVFGGRSGSKRLGDFWMLDTDIWQWLELTSFGDLPSAREFASASAIGNRKIVMYGGWDGKKWLSDVYILDTITLEWAELSIMGSAPPPRCGHTATMVEKRLLVFGGRGGGGPIMGDLWALKGLIEEENEMPGWTQLKLPGQPPSPRCGHTITSGGHYLLVFGGHGTGGWLSRYDIYYNECIVLDRISVQWKRLPTNNEPPLPRAYHSMTCIGARYLLFGGFDGKTTFGDIWWLVPEDDPIAKRPLPCSSDVSSESSPVISNQSEQSTLQENQQDQLAILELEKKLGVSVRSSEDHVNVVDEVHDKELQMLSAKLAVEVLPTSEKAVSIQALREHWKSCAPSSIQLCELGVLLRDYQRFIINRHRETLMHNSFADVSHQELEVYHFFHLKNASQIAAGPASLEMRRAEKDKEKMGRPTILGCDG